MVSLGMTDKNSGKNFSTTVPGGNHYSLIIKRGTRLRITDINGNSNLSTLFYNVNNMTERYNMADTIKSQRNIHIQSGTALYSDMGRIFCMVISDNCGGHDTIGGMTNSVIVEKKYGIATYQDFRNGMHRNSQDGFLIELSKYGLGKRDIIPNINFFSRLTVDLDGKLVFHENFSQAGSSVELFFMMNTLMVVAACQHPSDPDKEYNPKPISLTGWYCGLQDSPIRDLLLSDRDNRGMHNTNQFYTMMEY